MCTPFNTKKDKTIAKAANDYLEYYGRLYKEYFEHETEYDEAREYILFGYVCEARHVLREVFGVCSECIKAEESKVITSYGKNNSH